MYVRIKMKLIKSIKFSRIKTKSRTKLKFLYRLSMKILKYILGHVIFYDQVCIPYIKTGIMHFFIYFILEFTYLYFFIFYYEFKIPDSLRGSCSIKIIIRRIKKLCNVINVVNMLLCLGIVM